MFRRKSRKPDGRESTRKKQWVRKEPDDPVDWDGIFQRVMETLKQEKESNPGKKPQDRARNTDPGRKGIL